MDTPIFNLESAGCLMNEQLPQTIIPAFPCTQKNKKKTKHSQLWMYPKQQIQSEFNVSIFK